MSQPATEACGTPTTALLAYRGRGAEEAVRQVDSCRFLVGQRAEISGTQLAGSGCVFGEGAVGVGVIGAVMSSGLL